MLKDHANVMALFLQAGEVIGRKKLQKIIYIAKKMDVPFSERFKFHMFGPYSEELSLRMEELCNLGFVEEQKEDKGNYYQYRYALSEEGKRFLNLYQFEIPQSEALINELNGQSSRFLELVSTLLYFEDLTKDEVKEKVFTLKRKQNYSEEDIDLAYAFIETLRDTKQ
ncbi:YwgA family protein [Bacillus suaedae]|uniref:YwgA family protein n=1 Tax=Halalkalibacter suaedae TaxID=2822140 RepID=A0A941APG2_9BACI|nr:YwgA family protein [Bacillus suaedae]MBP3952750.1 YwgA family protein [Bacillus suaedae]